MSAGVRRLRVAAVVALVVPGLAAVVALVVPGLAAGASDGPSRPACQAEASVDPPRAVVGQQILYRVRIASRDDVRSVEWSHVPSFPSLRTETLPGDPQPALDPPRPGYRVRDERRALFAEAPGRYPLEAPPLRCVLRSGAVEIAPVPVVALEVVSAPAQGRPDDYAGLTGPVSVHLTVTPRELALGESVRVAVMVSGEGNLWTLASPYREDAFPGSERFERRPKLVLDRGRRLALRRHFVYDVVPRAEGTLHVPALALSYFDPVDGRYEVARAPATDVTVRPRPAPDARAGSAATAADAGTPDAATAPEEASRRRTGMGRAPLAGIAALLLGALGVFAWAWQRRARAARRSGGPVGSSGEAVLRPEDEATRLDRALRAALARHVEDAASVTPQELIAREPRDAAVATAAHLLAALERARFDPQAPPPDAAAVRRAIAAL